MEITSCHDDCVKVCLRPIFESNGIAGDICQKRLRIKVLGSFVRHSLASVAARDALGAILPAHRGDILSGVGRSDH